MCKYVTGHIHELSCVSVYRVSAAPALVHDWPDWSSSSLGAPWYSDPLLRNTKDKNFQLSCLPYTPRAV